MTYFSNTTVKENKVIFGTSTKKNERVIRKIGGLRYVDFNKKKYYLKDSSDWNYGPSLVEMSPDAETILETWKTRVKSWGYYIEFLDNIIDEYQNCSVEDSSSPSAPNTSSCRAIHKGNIEKFSQETYGRNSYRSGTYFQEGVKIGSGFPKGAEVFEKIYILSSIFSGALRYSNTDSKPTLSIVYGSAFTAVGIG